MSCLIELALLPFKLVLRLVAAVVGLLFMMVGGILTALIITAPIGIPLVTFGFVLIIRGFF